MANVPTCHRFAQTSAANQPRLACAWHTSLVFSSTSSVRNVKNSSTAVAAVTATDSEPRMNASLRVGVAVGPCAIAILPSTPAWPQQNLDPVKPQFQGFSTTKKVFSASPSRTAAAEATATISRPRLNAKKHALLHVTDETTYAM